MSSNKLMYCLKEDNGIRQKYAVKGDIKGERRNVPWILHCPNTQIRTMVIIL